MEGVLECAICMEKYNTNDKMPRILSCGHTFCTSCLRSMSLQKQNENLEDNINHDQGLIQCPLDKRNEISYKSIADIPINRLVLDIIEFDSSKNFKIKEMTHVVKAKERLKKIHLTYSKSLKTLKTSLEDLINAKNKTIDEIVNYFDNIISRLAAKKEFLLNYLLNFSNEKIEIFTDMITRVEEMKQISYNGLSKTDMVLKSKKNMPVSEEVNFVSSLDFAKLEDNNFINTLNAVLNETKDNDIYPKLKLNGEAPFIEKSIDQICDFVSLNVINDFNLDNVQRSKSNSLIKGLSFRDDGLVDMTHISSLSLSEIGKETSINKFLWFQQNSKNIFSYSLDQSPGSWIKEDNFSGYVLPEMFRISQTENDVALITGGFQDCNCLNKVVLYNKGRFVVKKNMHTERRNHSSIYIGDFIFICGGIDKCNNNISQCEKFSLTKNTWIKMTNMNSERSHLSLCNVNNQFIYAFGGENKYESLLNVIERYSIYDDTWDLLPLKIPINLECTACVNIRNEILLIGGFSMEYGPLDWIFGLDLDEMAIKQKEDKTDKSGWAVYTPMIFNRKVFIFFGGEENVVPNVVSFKLNHN